MLIHILLLKLKVCWAKRISFHAYTYFALVKRYGGVPIVNTVIDYPATVSIPETQLFRDSEEAVWDFISSDLDYAIAHLSAKRGTKKDVPINMQLQL